MRESRFRQNPFLSVSRNEYFTLIACLAVSIVFLFSNHNAQIERLRALVMGTWAQGIKSLAWFGELRDQHEELSRLRLRTTRLLLENSQLREAALENARLRAMLDFKSRSRYRLISARVIVGTLEANSRALTVDVGREQGVRRNMAVISPGGLVGKIIEVAKNSAKVQLLLDHNFRATCKIQRSRVNGILASESDQCWLTRVPKNSDVRPGDVVVTGEISRLFPTGILVGVVKKVARNNSSLFLDIQVEPAVDFSTLEEVFIVESFEAEITEEKS